MPHRTDLGFYRFAALAAVLAAGLSGSVAAAPAAFAAPTPLVVTTTVDAPVDASCADALPASLSLREALCQAQSLSDAAVTVPAGVVTLTAGALVYAPTSGGRSLTITGAGRDSTRVDAGEASRVLDLDRDAVGALDVTVADLTLAGGRPTSADATWGGGAVIAGSGVPGAPDALTLAGCRVTGSSNVPAGELDQGAVGGGVQMTGGTLTVRDCLVDASTASDAVGGGVAFVGLDAGDAVVVESSTFTGNASVGTTGTGVTGGGALFVSGDVDVTVTASTFAGNSVASTSAASALGSAVLVESGTATVSGSTVTGNTVTSPVGSVGSRGALVLAHGQVTTSRLAGNTTTVGGAVTRDAVRGGATVPRNWWGCVDPATGTGCDTAPDAATREPFARLTLAASPTIDLPGRTSAISGAVSMSDGSAVPAALAATLADLPLTWATTAGSLGGRESTLGADGTAGATLTIAAGDPRVSLGVDGSAATTTVTTAVPATVATQPVAASVVEGATATFTVVAAGTPTPTVQWRTSAPGSSTWADVPGATAATLTVPGTTRAMDGTRYAAVVQNGFGAPVTSSAVALAVRWGAEVTLDPADVTVVAGQDAEFTSQAAGKPAPTTTWERSTDGTTWAPVAAATGTTLTLPAVTAGDDGLRVRAVHTGEAVATTAAARLTVQTRPTLSAVAGAVVADGGTAQLTTTVGGSPAPAVRWQRLVGGTWTDVPGATGATLSVVVDPSFDGARYRAVATSVLVDGTSSATSNEAVLDVRYGPLVDVHPLPATGVAGGTALLTAAAHGNPAPTVQWQTSTDGTTWADVAGATDVIYARPLTLADDGLQVRARFSGHGTTDTTAVTLTVEEAPTVTDPVGTTVDAGGTATFTVSATGTPAPAVRWQSLVDGTWTDVPGATGPTYAVTATGALHGSSYRAVAVNVRGTAVSAAATLGVRTPPTVTDPADVLTRPGDDATFTVTTTGRPAPDVTWEQSVDGTTWTPVAGATGPSLTLTAAGTDDGLRVRAVATSTLGTGPVTVRSAAATLTVVPVPDEVSGPAPSTPVASVAGQPTTITFVVLGSDLSGRWEVSRDGGATWAPVGPEVTTNTITGVSALRSLRSAAPPATRTAFTATFTPTAADDGSLLRLVVSDAAGETVLRPVAVQVAAAPTPSASPTPTPTPGSGGTSGGTSGGAPGGASGGTAGGSSGGAVGTGGASGGQAVGGTGTTRASAAGGRLSSTGAAVGPTLAAAGVLLLLGAAGVVLARRRRA